MPNIKFTSLSADGELLTDDKIPFVDISDNAMGETGTNKIISASSLSNSVATLMSVNRLNGTKIVDGSLSSVKLSTGGPVWDASGNFSIGTSSSSSTLITSIGKNRTSPGTSELHLFSTVSNTANATIVREDSDNGNLTVSNTGTGNVILSQTGSGALIFSTAGSERVRIVPEGRVGIGKSNPATALDVDGTITAGSYSGDATLSGTPTAPTASDPTTATTQIATTAFVQSALGGAAIPEAPSPSTDYYYRGDKTWQTLNAAAVGLGNVTNESKATMFTSPTFTGTVSGISAAMVGLGNVNNTSDANKPVSTPQQNALNLKANIASPTFTGTPASVTATADTNTTQIATTAFVVGQASASTPLVNGTAAVGTSLRYARADHVHPTDTSLVNLSGAQSISGSKTFTSPLKISHANQNIVINCNNSNTTLPKAFGNFFNIVIGDFAMDQAQDPISNLGRVGDGCYFNTIVGGYAFRAAIGAEYNVGIGGYALPSNTTGSYNTGIGWYSLSNVTVETGCTGVGNYTEVTGNNQVQLGRHTTTTYAYGAVQNRSDARDKADIRDTILGLDFINSLRPVDFRWDMREEYKQECPLPPAEDATAEEKLEYAKAQSAWIENNKLANITHDGSKKRNRYHHGLIAQEVKAVLDEKGVDFGGYQDHSIAGGDDVLSIGYGEFIAPIIKAIQEQQKIIDSLVAEIDRLKN